MHLNRLGLVSKHYTRHCWLHSVYLITDPITEFTQSLIMTNDPYKVLLITIV